MGLLRSKKSYAMEIATKPLIMASEISGLEPLRGFIKQENRVVPVRFALTRKRTKLPEFLARKLPAPATRPSPALPATEAPTEPPKKPVAAQAALPLFDKPPAAKREGFSWDASKEIE